MKSSLYVLSAITIMQVAGQIYSYFKGFQLFYSIFQPEYLLAAFAGLLLLKILKASTNNMFQEAKDAETVNYSVNFALAAGVSMAIAILSRDFIIGTIVIGFASCFSLISLISIPPNIISDYKNSESSSERSLNIKLN